MVIASLWIISIVVGSVVGSLKNRGVLGFFLTLFLSWIGVIIIALMPKREIAPSMIVSQRIDHFLDHPDRHGVADITSFEEDK